MPGPNLSTDGADRSINGFANNGSIDSAAQSIDDSDRSIADNIYRYTTFSFQKTGYLRIVNMKNPDTLQYELTMQSM